MSILQREIWEEVAIDTFDAATSTTHTGTAVDVSQYVGGKFLLKLDETVVAPDGEDSWEIKLQGRTSSTGDWHDIGYWVDTVNAGDNVTTSGDPNRGRFDSDAASGQIEELWIDQLKVVDVRVIATAYDENADADMELEATITAFLKRR